MSSSDPAPKGDPPDPAPEGDPPEPTARADHPEDGGRRGEPRDPGRRRLLRAGLLFTGGVATGAAAFRLWDVNVDDRLDIDPDGVIIGNRPLREVVERTNTTADGVGVQRVVWSVPTDEKVISLTFDDGPDPEFTPRILEVLAAAGVTAHFNAMGFNAGAHPGLLREVVGAGHTVGNHTMRHENLAYQTRRGATTAISEAKEVIAEEVETPTAFLRPPRGVLTGSAADVASRLGYDILLWTSLISRPAGTRPSVIRDYTRERFEPGAIVSFHDGIGSATFNRTGTMGRDLISRRNDEIAALPAVIEAAQDDGYRFLTPDELLARA